MVLIFWLILLAVLSAIGGLAWWAMGAVVPGGRLTAYRRWLALLDVASPLALVAGIWLFALPDGVNRVFLIVLAAFWMMQLIFGVIVALVRGLRRLLLRASARPVDSERRRLLKGAAAYPLFAGICGVYGGTEGRTRTVVREIPVPLSGIGAELEGFRIAQLSDIHLGLFFSLDDLTALLTRTAALKPDV